MSVPASKHFLTCGLVLGILLLLAAVIIPTVGRTSSYAPRSVDASNLRQIMQASLLYAQDHQDQLPQATDVWDYAKLIAEGGGLESGAHWLSRTDPATASHLDRSIDVLITPQDGTPRQLNPAFRKLIPCWAVALGKLDVSMPATTPIAWTRGLQPDGTWAKHSPYGEDGGRIVFIGGNVAYYRNLKDNGGELVRFDGTGKTSNILEALPPGTRIGEYVPTSEEQADWSGAKRKFREITRDHGFFIGILLLWTPFLGLCAYRLAKKKSGSITVLVWPLLITIIAAIIVP